jgi:hypothetical protein
MSRSSSAFLRSNSCTRPGVPTTTCGAVSERGELRSERDATRQREHLEVRQPVPSLRICLATWSASSRVGTAPAPAAAPGEHRAVQQREAEGRGLAAARRVLARSGRDLPARLGRLRAWMGVIRTWPRASRPSISWDRAGDRRIRRRRSCAMIRDASRGAGHPDRRPQPQEFRSGRRGRCNVTLAAPACVALLATALAGGHLAGRLATAGAGGADAVGAGAGLGIVLHGDSGVQAGLALAHSGSPYFPRA